MASLSKRKSNKQVFHASPLQYPGGKTRAIKQLLQYLPTSVKRVCSPFLGGGSFELALAQKGIEVFGYDSFEPLVNFWQVLLAQPRTLSNLVMEYYPLSKQMFYQLQKDYFFIRDKKNALHYFMH